MKSLLTFLIYFSLFYISYSKKLWGSKKKQRDDDDSHSVQIKNNNAQSLSNKDNNGDKLFSQIISLSSNGDFTRTINNLLDNYFSSLQEVINDPEFFNSVNFDSISTIFNQFPALNEYREKFDTLKSQDPKVLQETIKEGFGVLKQSSNEIAAYLSDPIKLRQIISIIPAESQEIISSLLSGEVSSFKSLIDNIPGLSSTHKKLFNGLFSDDNSDLITAAKDVFHDESLIEEARQQFLENPELAESLGIPLDIIMDRSKWNALMKEGLNGLDDDNLIGKAI